MPSQREQVIKQAHERIARIRSDLNAMDYFSSGTLLQRTKICGNPRCRCAQGPEVLAAVAIRINLAEDAGGPKAPEVVETTGYLEWGGQTNGSSGSSGGLCSVVAGAYCLRASSNNCML